MADLFDPDEGLSSPEWDICLFCGTAYDESQLDLNTAPYCCLTCAIDAEHDSPEDSE